MFKRGLLNVIVNDELYDKDFVEKWTNGYMNPVRLEDAHPEGITVTLPPLMYKKFSRFFGGILRSILKITQFKDYPVMYHKYEGFLGGFLTPSKKVDIYSERLEEQGYDPLPVYREPCTRTP